MVTTPEILYNPLAIIKSSLVCQLASYGRMSIVSLHIIMSTTEVSTAVGKWKH